MPNSIEDKQKAQQEPGPSEESKAPDRVDSFPLFRTLFDLCKAFEYAHEQFPKIHKHSLGGRISLSLVEALEAVVAAVVQKSKREEHLIQTVIVLEKSRILLRLAYEIRCVDQKRYERFSRLIVSALEQTGAFLKSAKIPPVPPGPVPGSPRYPPSGGVR